MRLQLNKLLSFFLIVFLVSTSLSFIRLVYAADTYEISLDCDKLFYYLKGEPIIIYGTANGSASLTLSIYWNWKTFTENILIYQNTKIANATWTLPTTNVQAGYYRFVLTDGLQNVTVWRTLIHAEDYSSVSLPFSYEWQKINYTFSNPPMLNATFRDDFISIIYPSIPYQYSASIYSNNMSFLIRLSGTNWNVDISYWVIYQGLKWVINGTIPTIQQFDFQCSNNPGKVWKPLTSEFKSLNSYLTFSWLDLALTQQEFVFNVTTQILTVTIPNGYFSIDPYIFEDGFESGNGFGGWTATTGSPAISTVSHHGTNSCEVNANTEGAYKTIVDSTTIYVRVYCRWDATDEGTYTTFFTPLTIYHGTTFIAYVGFRQVAEGAYVLHLNRAFPTGDTYSTSIVFARATWYCIELKAVLADASTGAYQIWMDGTSKISETGLDTSGVAHCDRVYACGHYARGTDPLARLDCFVADTSYIGLEVSGQNLSFPLYQSLYVSGTHYKTMNLAFQSTDSIYVTGMNYFWKAIGFKTYNNINLYSEATMNKALQFSLFNFVSLMEYVRINKALGFSLFEVLKILDNATATFQIGGAKAVSFVVYGLLQLWGYDISNKHISFISEGLLHVWDNSSMSKAVVLRIFQVFSPLILNDYVSASFTIASGLTIDLAVGIGILALVLAVAGISLVVLRRKQMYA